MAPMKSAPAWLSSKVAVARCCARRSSRALRKFIVIADSSKLVYHLGRFPLPVEVIQMALPIVARKLGAFGYNPKLRHRPDGAKFITDEGNFILDCSCGEILDPAKTAAEIRGIPGVVDHGL